MSDEIDLGFSSNEILNVRFPLHRACRDGDVTALRSLLQCRTNHAALIAEDSVYGWTPIHWAAHFGKLECIMHLVQVGCEVNMMSTRFGQTPIHIAAFGGHPDCLLWLLRAGADIKRQDYAGETPIHKAAQTGSVECIKTLLRQDTSSHLRNSSGLTAADLAHAQGFQECFQLLSNAQNHLGRLNGSIEKCILNGNSRLCPSHGVLANRKRLMYDVESAHWKKAKTDNLLLGIQNDFSEDPESMNVDSVEDVLSVDHTTTLSSGANVLPATSAAVPGPPANKGSAVHAPSRLTEILDQQVSSEGNSRRSGDMCGSLHLTGSPSSSWEAMPCDWVDSLHYGHYHGFGDTAEDLTDTSIRTVQSHNQAVQLYHGS